MTTPRSLDTRIGSFDPSPASGEHPPLLQPLHKLPQTWKIIWWWTLWYGSASWITEYLFSQLDPAGGHRFMFGLSRMVYAFNWGWAAAVAVFMTDWRPITSGRQYGRVLLHSAVCLVVVVGWATLSYYINVAIVPGWEALGIGRMLSTTAKNVLFGYGVLVVLVHIVHQMRMHRQREVTALRAASLATQAQLQVLKMELQPHFLFNALHSISSLMHSDVKVANETLVLLSDMLRHAVDTSRVQEVPLRDELATVQLFTQIEQVRFGERLRLSWDVRPETLDAAVPHMLLQPLLENAIKHGLEVDSSAGSILLAARRTGDELELSIHNDGPGFGTDSPRRGAGVGITNTRARLKQLYGTRQSLAIVSTADAKGTRVTIRMPFRVVIPPPAFSLPGSPSAFPGEASGAARAPAGGV